MRAPRVTLFKRADSKYWYCSYYIAGQRQKISLGTANKTMARARADQIQAELLAVHLGVEIPRPRKPVTLGEVFDTYRRRLVPGHASPTTIKVQSLKIDRLETVLGGREFPVTSLTSPFIEKYLLNRLASGVTRTTLYNDVIVLKAAFNQAIRDGLIESEPFRINPDLYKGARRRSKAEAIPESHLTLIRDGLDCSHLSDRMILLAMVTGLRYSDLRRLDWKQVDFKTGEVKPFRTQKTDTLVSPIIPGFALSLLEPHRQVAGPICDVRSGSTIRGRTRVLCGASYGTHAFRHTLITRLSSQGNSPKLIARIVGHTDTAMTMRYTHPDRQEEKDAILSLWSEES